MMQGDSLLHVTTQFTMRLKQANTTEARAISRGIALANEIGCDRIIIQSDCLQVVQALQSSFFFHLRQLLQFSMTFMFSALFSLVVGLAFAIGKQALLLADRLSREMDTHHNVWADDLPSFIVALLINNVSFVFD
jgi:hypothetical protein